MSTRSGPHSWMYSASRTLSHMDCIGPDAGEDRGRFVGEQPRGPQFRQAVGDEGQGLGDLQRELVP